VHPSDAIELHELHLVKAAIICRAGIYPDSRQEERILYVVTIGSYMHHVFACEIVAALLEKVDYGLRKSIAVSCKSVIQIALWIIGLPKRKEVLHAFVIGPNWIVGVLRRAGRNYAYNLLDACGGQCGND
jgi:hypothetical protein